MASRQWCLHSLFAEHRWQEFIRSVALAFERKPLELRVAALVEKRKLLDLPSHSPSLPPPLSNPHSVSR